MALYALALLRYTVASPDPNPRGGVQLPNPTSAILRQPIWVTAYELTKRLPNPNGCNSMLTSATRGEMPTPDPNEFNFTLTNVIYIINNISFREMFFSTAQTD